MNKDKKKIAISICVCISAVAVLAAVYVLIRKKAKKESANTDATAATADSHPTTVEPSISLGSRGSAVKVLQRSLNDKLVSNYLIRADFPVDKNGARITQLDVDGIFGPNTEAVCLWWYGKTSITMQEL